MFTQPERLSTHSADLIMSSESEVFVSVASYWELKIKAQKAKFEISRDLISESQKQGIQILGFMMSSVDAIDALPLLHHDPFDRAILAHSLEHKLTLLTADKVVQNYSAVAKIIAN